MACTRFLAGACRLTLSCAGYLSRCYSLAVDIPHTSIGRRLGLFWFQVANLMSAGRAMEELLNDFLTEATDQIDQVERQIVQFEQDPSDAEAIAQIFRLVHTLKGTSGFLELPRLERVTHAAETLLGRVRKSGAATPRQVDAVLQTIDTIQEILTGLETSGSEPEGEDDLLIEALKAAVEDSELEQAPSADSLSADALSGHVDESPGRPPSEAQLLPPVQEHTPAKPNRMGNQTGSGSIRVMISTIERIMRLVSELVLTRNQLLELAREESSDTMSAPLQRLSAITTDLQDGIMKARMQRIDRLFASLPRMVRELGQELNKSITLVVEGSDTELDRQLIEHLRDPLLHLIRNCVDHGIEDRATRSQSKKPENGTITVTASQEGGFISIRISDDGRGIDHQRIRDQVIAKKLAPEDQIALMDNDEICRFIFAPGFSTAQSVSNISGRGIGMDVVRANIESIGGNVSLTTTPGQGTTFIMKVPLTLAIIPALIFEVGAQRFAIPQNSVVEAVTCDDGEKSRVVRAQGSNLLQIRDQNIILADFKELCNFDPGNSAGEFPGTEITAQAQDASRPANDSLAIIAKVGALQFAIEVDRVLDVQEIVVKPLSSPLTQVRMFAGNTILGDGSVVLIVNPTGVADLIGLDSAKHYTASTPWEELPQEKEATSFVLFRDADGIQKGVPLSLLSRIEEIDSVNIAHSDGQVVVHHNNTLMPVIDLANSVNKTGQLPVLVIGVGGEPMGLIVSEIIDIVEHQLEIDIAGRTPGIIGTTEIRGAVTSILDITHFMRTARPGEFERRHAKRFRVLVVDDKPFFRDMLAPLIAASGYDTKTASSAADAIIQIKRGTYDIILTDLDMPDVNGYELAKMIREIPRYAKTPIMALDAFAGREVVEAAAEAGMDGVVGKFDRELLITCLRDTFEATAFNTSNIEARMEKDKAA